jgi:hypothetical protein
MMMETKNDIKEVVMLCLLSRFAIGFFMSNASSCLYWCLCKHTVMTISTAMAVTSVEIRIVSDMCLNVMSMVISAIK